MVETIFLIRHAESAANYSRTYAGWSDSVLTPLGLRQAAALKKRFSREHIGHAFCSDLQRARKTYEAIGLSCPVEYTDALRERNYGTLEGSLWDADPERKKHHVDPFWRAPEGESPQDVQERVWKFFQERVFTSSAEKVLVVSHHGPLIAFACKFLDMPLNRWRGLKLGNAGLSILIKEDGLWRMSLWNSLSGLGLLNDGPLLEPKGKKK